MDKLSYATPKSGYLRCLGGLCIISLFAILTSFKCYVRLRPEAPNESTDDTLRAQGSSTAYTDFRCGKSCEDTCYEKKRRVLDFPLSSTNLRGPGARAVPVAFSWFSYPVKENISVIGPGQTPLSANLLGRFMGDGDFVWEFERRESGDYSILHNGEHLATYSMHPDASFCPEPMVNFESRYRCKAEDADRIRQATARWPDGSVTEEMYDKLGAQGNLVHFAIINNTLYRRFAADNIPYRQILEKVLLSVLRKVKLPDAEFAYGGSDGGTSPLSSDGPPVLAFTKTDLDVDILIPSGYLMGDLLSGNFIKGAASLKPWTARQSKCYFVGTNTGYLYVSSPRHLWLSPRFRAAMLARGHEDIMQVKVMVGHKGAITREAAAAADKLNLTIGYAPSSAVDHKCLIHIDGNSASWRLGSEMAEGHVIVKQTSPYAEHFYDLLEPCVHFLEMEHYMGDLVARSKWALTHEAVSREITTQAFSFAMSRLVEEEMMCYMALLIDALSRISASPVRLRGNFTRVPDEGIASAPTCIMGL